MKKLYRLFVFFLIAILQVSLMARGDDQSDILRVLWTVSQYKILDKSKISEREAMAFLSKPLDIGDTSITFDGNTCSNVTFHRQQDVNSKDYFSSYFNILPQDIGIRDPVLEVIRTSCSMPGFSEYLRLPDRRLVIFRNGAFFFFSPWVTY